MKTQLYKHQNHLKKLLLTFALFLTACNEQEDKSTSEYKGRTYASHVKAEIYNQYLACYALGEAEKKQCNDQLIAEHIEKRWQVDKEYIQAFHFEAEKLGFKHFLNNSGLSCESIKDGPKFIPAKKAYLVACKSDTQYLMRFNYDTKVWQLVEEEGNND